jgi:hypothetical protein
MLLLTSRMKVLGPSLNTEPVADTDKPKGILEAFLVYFGMDFWELVAEQTNLISIQGTLHSLKITAAEIVHLTGIGLVVGTVKLPQVTVLEQTTLASFDMLQYV